MSLDPSTVPSQLAQNQPSPSHSIPANPPYPINDSSIRSAFNSEVKVDITEEHNHSNFDQAQHELKQDAEEGVNQDDGQKTDGVGQAQDHSEERTEEEEQHSNEDKDEKGGQNEQNLACFYR